MDVDFDPVKNEKNIKERRLSFERAKEVDFNTALVFPDTRKAYGETRYNCTLLLGSQAACAVFHETETGIRVISFRKANTREAIRYGKPQTVD